MRSRQNLNLYDHWDRSSRSYNFFGDYLHHKYGFRIYKLPVNAGFSCPNRDGTLGTEGCIFCSEEGSASPTAATSENILHQMLNAKLSFRRSDAQTKYIAYFQAFTNTYSDAKTLKHLYDSAVSVRDIIGLMIATRPDCLPEDILDLIAGYLQPNIELMLEIRMQTMHDKSLIFLNRGHTHADTIDAINRASRKNIPVCVHIILGIPDESWKDMMETAAEISSLPVSGVKIHHLHVIKGTRLEKYYKENKITLLDFKEYISLVCDFLERLRSDITIHRLIGDRSIDSLIAPKWANNKGTVLKAIEDEFRRRCTIQGFLFDEF